MHPNRRFCFLSFSWFPSGFDFFLFWFPSHLLGACFFAIAGFMSSLLACLRSCFRSSFAFLFLF